jgi:hypothetical protein
MIDEEYDKFCQKLRSSMTYSDLTSFLKLTMDSHNHEYVDIFSLIRNKIKGKSNAAKLLFESNTLIIDILKDIRDPQYITLLLPFCDFDIKSLKSYVIPAIQRAGV